jgi:hypothetical protein
LEINPKMWHNFAVIMAKTRNLLETATLTISTNPLVEDRLERLVLTGAYGKNSAEAAERLLALTLHTLDKQGEIPPRPSGKRPHKRQSATGEISGEGGL